MEELSEGERRWPGLVSLLSTSFALAVHVFPVSLYVSRAQRGAAAELLRLERERASLRRTSERHHSGVLLQSSRTLHSELLYVTNLKGCCPERWLSS